MPRLVMILRSPARHSQAGSKTKPILIDSAEQRWSSVEQRPFWLLGSGGPRLPPFSLAAHPW